MRLDKFLKQSRLIKRRTVANKVCSAQKVLLNGKIAKPSSLVKENDILEINMSQTVKVKILKIMTITNKKNASDMYEII